MFTVACLLLWLQQGQVGTTGSLVDKDGYPRDDIDIYAVRMARNKVISE